MISGVIFDFSGTPLRIESTEQSLRGILYGAGHNFDDSEITACARRLEVMGALPGGRLRARCLATCPGSGVIAT